MVDTWISGMSRVTSLRLPPVSDACNGMPCNCGDQVMIRASSGTVDRARSGFWAALHGPQVCAASGRYRVRSGDLYRDVEGDNYAALQGARLRGLVPRCLVGPAGLLERANDGGARVRCQERRP